MPRIYKPTGPSVALRESQRGGDPGFIQAPNQTQQIDSLGRQAQGYMQSYQEQANRNARFEQTALARSQQAQEGNAQLALQQMQSRGQMALRADEMQGRQALEVEQLRMGQKASANQIALQQAGIQNQQITELGNQVLRFSQTLWEQRAKQINEKNEETRLQGLNDYLSGIQGNAAADVARVDQAEILRTQGTVNAESAALDLESQGRKVDATIVRAANPFYLKGQQEGQAMQAGLGYGTYVNNRIRQAIDSGQTSPLKATYQDELKLIIASASKDYIKENSLTAVNPAILAKYFGYTKAQVEAQALESYSNQAYKEVKKAQQETADAQVYNAAGSIRAMPREQWTAELQRLAIATTSGYGMNPFDGHMRMLQMLIKEGNKSNSFDLVDAFMTTDRGGGDGTVFGNTPGLQEVYDEARTQFDRIQSAQLEQLRENQLEGIVANFDRVFATGDVPAIREAQDATVSRLMELGTPEAMAKARQIASTNPGESPLIQESLRRAEDGGYLDRFLRENRDRMTASTYEKFAKRAEQTSKLKEPAYKQAMDQTLAAIRFAAGEANEQQMKLLPPHAKKALDDYTKLQGNKLQQYAREWLSQNSGSNLKDFQDWLKGQEKSYTDPRQFLIDPQSNLPRGMQSMGGGVEFTGNPQVFRVTYGGRMREDYRTPNVQAGLASGSISPKAIQFETDLVFSKQQISEAVANYEKNGTWPNYMVQIADRTGRTVKSMVQAQARVYGGSGVIVDPGNFKLPPSSSGSGKVSFDAVKDFARSSGISDRGAIAFATMVQDESAGNPFARGDSGASQGLMQWNQTYSPDRVRRLQQFAKQRGKPVTDPGIQLNYAIYEMKNFYPSVWSVLSSRNPTNNQLWRASVEYLGFDASVEARRKASLEANLR
jgi:hypothetical protein